jgi:hypothetical protein
MGKIATLLTSTNAANQRIVNLWVHLPVPVNGCTNRTC